MGINYDLGELRRGVDALSDDYNSAIRPLKDFAEKMLRENVDSCIEKIDGGLKRIGVFGPYNGDNKKIVDEICWYVADKGYLVFTDFGFYHPRAPKSFVSLDTVLTPTLIAEFNDPQNRPYFYHYILPSLIDGAIAKLNPLRTQGTEVDGCQLYNKPVLGFINHPDIGGLTDLCNWITIVQKTPRVLSCDVNHYKSCPIDSKRPINCIFYKPEGLPQIVKDTFLPKFPIWRYLALEDYVSIFLPIDQFLGSLP